MTFSTLDMKMAHMAAFGLLVIGGLNWLLVGAVQWDIGMLFGGQDNIVSRIIYLLVGLSALYIGATHMSDCKKCSAKGSMSSGGMGSPQA